MTSHRGRFEFLFATGWLAFGALILPALVYAVGVALLGKYADGSLGAFYANLYGDLFSGATAPLTLILGPYVVLMLARLPLIGRRRAERNDDADDAPARSPRSRVEPRVGG